MTSAPAPLIVDRLPPAYQAKPQYLIGMVRQPAHPIGGVKSQQQVGNPAGTGHPPIISSSRNRKNPPLPAFGTALAECLASVI
jgi:hypothetical protein